MKRFCKLAALAAAITGCFSSSDAAVVDTLTVATQYLSTPMKVPVVTPDGIAEGDTLPSVYILNGFGGDYRTWLGRVPRVKELADRYMMVLVFPDGRDSWYWDSPVDPSMKMESFFVNDLVKAVEEAYPVSREASRRAITGLSMGGHGALWLAMRHPDIWGSAGSMSGGVDIVPYPEKWKIAERLGKYDGNEHVWERHSVSGLADSLEPGRLNLIVDCGIDDFFIGINNDLHQKLAAKGIEHDYTVRPGRHTWKYWANSILYQLLFFDEVFSRR